MPGYCDIAIDCDRIAVRAPYSNKCATRERTDTGLRIHREQGGRERAIDRITAAQGDFNCAVSSELRRRCDSNLGHEPTLLPRKGLSVMNDRSNALAFVHQIERFVDVFERHRVGDELVDLDATVHVLVDHFRQL